MEIFSQQRVIREVSERLAELLEVAPGRVRQRARSQMYRADAVLESGAFVFVVEWKRSGAAGPVAAAAEQARRYAAEVGGKAIPLVVVPYMGKVGRESSQYAGVAWLDLSGNARIVAPGIHIIVEGRPNRFKRRGRPSSVFAPKASRISRWLLIHRDRPMTQREIAQATNMDEGYTSRVVGRLEEDGLVVRDHNGGIRAPDPSLLLDAWSEAYDFEKHSVVRGNVAARSGDILLRRLTEVLRDRGVDHAASGLGAAWLMTRRAGFRLVTIYVREHLPTPFLSKLSFSADSRGANVWLVEPNDEGVFHGALDRGGIRCVHPVQVYLDLGGHPERSEEAAAELRTRLLNWKTDG